MRTLNPKRIITGILLAICIGLGITAAGVSARKAYAAEGSSLTVTSEQFKVKGASVRYVDEEYGAGVKFHILLDKTIFDGLNKDTAETGVRILPTALLGETALKDYTGADVITKRATTLDGWFDSETDAGMKELIVFVYDIPADNYGTDLAVIGYVTDGNTVYTEQASFSLAYVAKAAAAADETKKEQLESYYKFDCVLYNADGTKKSAAKVEYEEKLTAPTDDVCGWYNKAGTKKWDFDNGKVTGKVSLYAKAHDYSVQAHDADYHWNTCKTCGKADEDSKTEHSATVWQTVENGRIGKCECGETVITAVENVKTDDVTLKAVAGLNGKNYDTETEYAPVVTVNDKTVTVDVTVDGDAVEYKDGKLTAKKVGTATVKVSYTVTEGVTENKSFTVTVEKVVETIDTAVAYFSALDGKDKTLDNPVNMFALFDGVTFTAKQTYNGTDYDLTVDGVNKKLTGAHDESKTPAKSVFTLSADAYDVVYNNVTVYTKVISDYTDFEDMRLTADRKTVTGYFIMNADVDFTNKKLYNDSVYATAGYNTYYPYTSYPSGDTDPKTYLTEVKAVRNDQGQYVADQVAGFVGTFDGNGHNINAFRAGNSYGLFGTICGRSLSDMTVIKNVALTNIVTVWESWTKTRILAEYATLTSIENVYMSYAATANYTANFSIFGCAETVYFRFNRVILELGKTFDSAATGAEGASVGIFASAGTTRYYGDLATEDQWHGQMKTVYQNLYLIAPVNANGRIMPLHQTKPYTTSGATGTAIYASNDTFEGLKDGALISLNATTFNPEADASGTMKIYYWKNAYRYDTYEDMKTAGTTKVGNWDISSGKPVWAA